jgi:hypothetical protein
MIFFCYLGLAKLPGGKRKLPPKQLSKFQFLKAMFKCPELENDRCLHACLCLTFGFIALTVLVALYLLSFYIWSHGMKS